MYNKIFNFYQPPAIVYIELPSLFHYLQCIQYTLYQWRSEGGNSEAAASHFFFKGW